MLFCSKPLLYKNKGIRRRTITVCVVVSRTQFFPLYHFFFNNHAMGCQRTVWLAVHRAKGDQRIVNLLPTTSTGMNLLLLFSCKSVCKKLELKLKEKL